MPIYKLYILGRNRRIERAVDLDCEDDAQCIREAHRRAAGPAMELWLHDRLVKEFPATEAKR